MDEQRLDKWLWCARFYKTRSLATDAIDNGRVAVNGQIAKPSKAVRPGDRLEVKLPPYRHDLDVLGIAKQRGPAAEAQRLYAETPESIAARERLSEQLRASAIVEDRAHGKLNKKERRERALFKRDLRS
ncbi:MAG: RNA-binding S4 domain-containing protein [Gammaproteobacteria bacterium]|nr:RNA-binding S4 domain-containing protein [Gammaproteobacteria bacterium]MBI5618123.1 RNA-binding S4 domain-containing protein [Gammaproteobacteria bacterium]